MTNKETRLLIFFSLLKPHHFPFVYISVTPPESFLCPFNRSPAEKEGSIAKKPIKT